MRRTTVWCAVIFLAAVALTSAATTMRIVPIVRGPPLDHARGALSKAERAPATLGAAIPVELSRPRSVAQLAHDEQATHVRAHVIATLTASPGRLKKPARRQRCMPSARCRQLKPRLLNGTWLKGVLSVLTRPPRLRNVWVFT